MKTLLRSVRMGLRGAAAAGAVGLGVALAGVPVAVGADPAAALAALSSQDKTAALRTALTQGAQAAVGKLGVVDGFLGNPEVKIPLPGKLKKGEKLLRTLGLGDEADELVTAMNRAAEAAVPEAKGLLVDAVKTMSVQDATAILTGGDDAATQYFKRTTSEKLAAKFLPIVQKSTAKVGAAQKYNELAGQASKYGLVDAKDASVENYVTQKALDGLFVMMAKEEKAIRTDPLGQSSRILKKVFGAVAP
jgi:Protein of unknown function (DUF4197)